MDTQQEYTIIKEATNFLKITRKRRGYDSLGTILHIRMGSMLIKTTYFSNSHDNCQRRAGYKI